MNNILGINGDSAHKPKSGSHDSGACLVRQGHVIAAANEERFSRIKQDDQYPFDSIRYIASFNPNPGETQAALTWLPPQKQHGMLTRLFQHMWHASSQQPTLRKLYWKQQHSRWARLLRIKHRTLPTPFTACNIHPIIEHHHAHAASAYYCSPFPNERVLVLTLDGQGDFASGSAWLGQNGNLDAIEHFDALNSIGNLYAAFTAFLGFTANRHEGKIVGLAAHGDPDKLCNRLLQKTNLNDPHALFDGDLILLGIRHWIPESKAILEQLCRELTREDIAAGIQVFTEKVVTHIVQHLCQQHRCNYIAAAGGVFANVKLNQRILELDCVENMYIHPNMGDGGLAVGAALAAYAAQQTTFQPIFMESAYLGPTISQQDAEEVLNNARIQYEQPDDLAEQVAKLLANGKVVARAAGRMEYGPRALGNRTLFASCNDPSINQWLNEKLQRTEFMPFAPIIMEEYAAEYFPAWKPEHIAARFMTITYDASDIAKKNIPAAIHVDGTARPQVLREQDNPEVYAILKAYHAKTGVPALINTSFNMHEEPIVCSAYDAIRAFQLGHLDVLICGPCLTEGKAL